MAQKSSISNRQAKILAAIVKEYAATAEPVGSEVISEHYKFGFSAATIRNEMRALEKSGYIKQPHTSAGRIPTDEGYRYFITQLMRHAELTARERNRLRQELVKLQSQYTELGRSITRLLSETSQSAAFALLPQSSASAGLSNIVDAGLENSDLKQVASFFDNLDSHSRELVVKKIDAIQTYVGSEGPIPLSRDVSMVVAQVNLPSGERGVVGIVGPKRMKYAKNISLLEYISKLISGGLPIIMFLIDK